jgi:Tfp pilus assembly protein PilO
MNVNLETSKIKNMLINFLVPLASLALCAVLFFVVIYPDIKKLPQLQQELQTQTALRNQLQEKSAKLHRFVDFKNVLEENSELVNQVMPAEQNVPGLLDQVNQIADESGMSLTRLSYSISDGANIDVEPTAYNAVLISLGAEGTYAQMVTFMEAIENASRAVNISNYRFTDANASEVDGQYGFTFILNAPYLLVQSSAVTDEALGLDLTSPDFVNFITKVKGLRYFEKSGDLSNIKIDVTQEDDIEETAETTPSVRSTTATPTPTPRTGSNL